MFRGYVKNEQNNSECQEKIFSDYSTNQLFSRVVNNFLPILLCENNIPGIFHTVDFF